MMGDMMPVALGTPLLPDAVDIRRPIARTRSGSTQGTPPLLPDSVDNLRRSVARTRSGPVALGAPLLPDSVGITRRSIARTRSGSSRSGSSRSGSPQEEDDDTQAITAEITSNSERSSDDNVQLIDRSSPVVLPVSTLQGYAAMTASTMKDLEEQGYTRGLAEALLKNKLAFPLSIWLLDNSGSMMKRDGYRLLETSSTNLVKFLKCTRWAEMQQTVDYHSQMAAMLKSPTVFRLLNDPGRIAGQQQFSIAERGDDLIYEDLLIAQSTMMNTTPSGSTPLSARLQEVGRNIRGLETSLRREGTKVALVIATDAIPTGHRGGIADKQAKEELVETLRSLEGLPVWIVVRVCSDDPKVLQFWNSLDYELELSLEVLDDYQNEAIEVYEHNMWLNYGLQIHRMREAGFYSRLFDILDERPLAKDELRGFFRILFGDYAMKSVPDPEADWNGFLRAIEFLVKQEKKTWHPIRKRMEPWVDMHRLRVEYGGGWCCC
jgi:hypothetical protein